MDYPDYRDENGKVWTQFDVLRTEFKTPEERQLYLDAMAERSGWSRYEQPDPYTEN